MKKLKKDVCIIKMKAEVISLSGEKIKEIELPSFFSDEIREDIVQKVFEAQKTAHPYGPDPEAGRKHSASGRIRHIRHKWRSAYGRGISRIPRKTMWRRGTQFYWIGAEISGTRGGRRAHGPKILQFVDYKKINKKELILALKSAIASTGKEEVVSKRYGTINKKLRKFPLVVESKISSAKSKELSSLIGKMLGDNKNIAEKQKSLRSGRGKRCTPGYPAGD